jgi:tetratricopeptide (TPR) repeat protein
VKAQKKKQPLSEQSLRELAGLKTESSRKKFISAHRRLFDDSVVRQLNEVVRTKLREDPHEALFLAEASVVIARRLRNQEALGRSLRSKANSLYMLGDNQEALEFHGEALRIFREIPNPEEEARTLIPSIQPLILLGKYDQAFGAAEDAKKIFRQLNDDKRWAHVEINVGQHLSPAGPFRGRPSLL